MENMFERKKTDLGNQSGFTLLEIMSVLVILGVIFSVTIHQFTTLSDTAYKKGIESAIQELNIRETLTWYDLKISNAGWINDTDVFNRLDTNLGAGYRWNPAAGEIGGSLHFGPHTTALTRSQSTNKSAGSWQ
jgi:prepilin-type N-terminal cleavage/methylation domain-containing protein